MQLMCHRNRKHLFEPYFKRWGICSQLIASKVLNNGVHLVPRFLENKQINNHKTTHVFSDDYKVANPKLAPNSSSDVKVIEIMPYPGVNGTGPLGTLRMFIGMETTGLTFKTKSYGTIYSSCILLREIL